MLGSGDAYPEGLPDVSEFAQRAAVRYRTRRAEGLGVQVLPASQFHATPGPRNYVRLAYPALFTNACPASGPPPHPDPLPLRGRGDRKGPLSLGEGEGRGVGGARVHA
jgi:hypothetical protein